MTKYLTNQYNRAYKALTDLGLDTPIKLEQISLNPDQEKQLKSHKAVMVLTPKIDKDFNTKDLLNKLGTFWEDDYSLYYSSLWDKCLKDDYQEPSVSFAYMDGQRGLYGKGKSLEDNKKQLAKLQSKNPKLHAMNPIEYMLLQVIYKNNPLDIGWNWTRFIDKQTRGLRRGGNWSHGSSAGVLALNLHSAPSGANTGVGFRVAQDIQTLPKISDLNSLNRWRADFGHAYYYISLYCGHIITDGKNDLQMPGDYMNHEIGNYFKTKAEVDQAAIDLRKFFEDRK